MDKQGIFEYLNLPKELTIPMFSLISPLGLILTVICLANGGV
jgi:hypothetical protein